MKTLTKRITALEARRPGKPTPFCVHHREGETFDQAAHRQGITTGSYLSIAEPMAMTDWCEAARVQQAAMVAGMNP